MRCKQNHFGQVRGTKKATLFLSFFLYNAITTTFSEEHHFVEMFHPWLNSRTICSRAWCLKVFSLTDLFLVVWSVTFSVNFWLRWTFQFLRNTHGHLPFVDYRKKNTSMVARAFYITKVCLFCYSRNIMDSCVPIIDTTVTFFVRAPHSSFHPDQHTVLQDCKLAVLAEGGILQTCAP